MDKPDYLPRTQAHPPTHIRRRIIGSANTWFDSRNSDWIDRVWRGELSVLPAAVRRRKPWGTCTLGDDDKSSCIDDNHSNSPSLTNT